VLGLALGWNALAYHASLIADADWAKLKGEHGALFAVSIGLIVVWLSNTKATRDRLVREQKAEELKQARADALEVKNDERHKENRRDMQTLTEKLTGLTAESIKANVLATVALQNAATQAATVAGDVEELSAKVKSLTDLLAVSPCLATMKLRADMAASITDEGSRVITP
jgi:hypothetical protein